MLKNGWACSQAASGESNDLADGQEEGENLMADFVKNQCF